jgi:hypothetical protein
MTQLLLHGLAWLVFTNVALAGNLGGDGGATRHKGASQVARVGREFRVRVGRTVMLEGENLRLRFAAVAEDSRCPTGVTCVWAGNAVVLIEAGTKGVRGKRELRLNTNASRQSAGEGTYRRYTVKLVGLSPYPREGQKIAPGAYTATLLVVRE